MGGSPSPSHRPESGFLTGLSARAGLIHPRDGPKKFPRIKSEDMQFYELFIYEKRIQTMRITKSQLQRIIKEEIKRTLYEDDWEDDYDAKWEAGDIITMDFGDKLERPSRMGLY